MPVTNSEQVIAVKTTVTIFIFKMKKKKGKNIHVQLKRLLMKIAEIHLFSEV